MISALIILTLITLLLLFGGRPLVRIDSQTEMARRIAQYDEALAEHGENGSAKALAERRWRLYHELQDLLNHKTTGITARLPLWAIIAVFIATLTACGLWFLRQGMLDLREQRIAEQTEPLLHQIRVYGADALPEVESAQQIILCQLLQRSMDREDTLQLHALGRCYSAMGAYQLAQPVYQRLLRLTPDDPETLMQAAQVTLFAQPDAAMSDTVANQLQRVIALQPDNILAKILLATGYTRDREFTTALPLWQDLRTTTPTNHPLFSLIEQTEAQVQAELTRKDTLPMDNPSGIAIQVTIAQTIIEASPPQAQLFILAAPPGQTMPVAVKKLSLQADTQLTLNDQDMMMPGGSLQDYPKLEIRAKITRDGTATGETLASATSAAFTPPPPEPIELQLSP